ncbi:MAG: hypothetical protein BroJett011_54360 [Chloroflexota bacterium]|nr:MAG: hypothetical protein BroJett011_54360 [Chloroflexota bacterium]
MANSKIDPLQMEMIVERIRVGRCVPFLGAAANISNLARGYAGLKLGSDVARELASQMNGGGESANLARIALQYEVRTDRSFLVRKLKMALPDQNCEPSPLLKTLARLPFQLIVTTNYDRLLEEALKGQAFESIVQPAQGFEDTPATRGWLERLEAYDGLILYKIHGTFLGKAPPDPDQEDEELSPLIITEDDYIQYLSVVGKETEMIGIPNLIKKKITPSTLLFLGYSLEDWDFRTIYKVLIEPLPKHHRRKSLAIQNKPALAWQKFWAERGVEIWDVDVYDFAEQLEECYLKKPGETTRGD